ncbi:MAG: alginate lyase family protein, partial [Verrucomicrobiota bacterium]
MPLGLFRALLAAPLLWLSCAAADFAFTHPGLLHTQEDLARMRTAVAAREEPSFSSFEKLRVLRTSQLDYVQRGPFAEIGRNPTISHVEFDTDATAAYHCALMWCITGDRRFADRAMRLVDAWSTTLQLVSGADAVLMAGLGPFKLINAAELLRHTDSGWSAEDAAVTEDMFRRVFVTTLQNFAPFANGNWDTAAIKTLLAVAVFCNDRPLFERALRYYVAGSGNGRLTHYIVDDTGQCQESGRDMGHTQLGLAHLGDAAEIAWHQGLDLYAYADNRLLKGFEYTARYNLGETVPFRPILDRTGKYRHTEISAKGRGALRPVYEQIYHHYVHRAGLAAPWTQRAAEKLRPEGESRPSGDHTGFGTLLYTRSASPPLAQPPFASSAPAAPFVPLAPAAPAAVIAQPALTGIALTWIAPRGATNYTVSRGAEVIARDLTSPAFIDTAAQPGQLHTYTVSAKNLHGIGPASAAVTVSASLPEPWKSADIGEPALHGSAQHDGSILTLEAHGANLGELRDQFHFAYAPLPANGTLIARFTPPVSSQLGRFGLVFRAHLAPDAPSVALLIVPDTSRELERPGWKAQLVVRTAESAVRILGSVPLAAPLTAYGRLMQPCWLRLTRRSGAVS